MSNTVNIIGQWYRRAFAEAAARQGLIAEPKTGPLALKLLEEVIELAFALGVDTALLHRQFNAALNKEHLKSLREGNRLDVVDEMADCTIVLTVLAEIAGVPLETVSERIEAKSDINEAREWDVNIFGSLSHRKKASQEEQPQ